METWADGNGNTNTNTNTYRYTNGNGYSDANSVTHGYPDSHADGYSHSNTYGDPDSYAGAHSDPDGYTDAHRDTDTYIRSGRLQSRGWGARSHWTKPLASDHNLVIVNNQVGVDFENSSNFAFWSADSFSEDKVPRRLRSRKWAIGRAQSFGRMELWIGFTLDSYRGRTTIRFTRRWDGSYYLLANGTAETWQVGDVLKVGVIGSANPVTVTLYHNGNAVLSWTSSSQAEVKNGGSPGIGIYSPGGEALTLDNWEGGNLGAGHATAQCAGKSCGDCNWC